MNFDELSTGLGLTVIAAPAVLATLFILLTLARRSVAERAIGAVTSFAVLISLAAAVGTLITMLTHDESERVIHVFDLVTLPGDHFSIRVALLFDRLSIPFLLLTLVLTGLIGAFANRYLHRDRGYQRFFLYYSIFLLGMVTASIAGTIETLFIGWELVGLSSVLLIGYFQDRPRPVMNGQWVWSVYRLSDAAFLVAVVALHHTKGHGDFGVLIGDAAWPDSAAMAVSPAVFLAGILMLLAVAGKSALLPFSNWLPRAMEGPTPSSAVFYGALSVHLGVFLLLRASPVFESSVVLRVLVVALGLATAAYGGAATRVQTDVKSRLAYASVAQVGLITAEIGLGWYYLALAHICGHAFLRALQLLRAPSILEDYRRLENASGAFPGAVNDPPRNTLRPLRTVGLYRALFDRSVLDTVLQRLVIAPFLWAAHTCDSIEKRVVSPTSQTPSDTKRDETMAAHADADRGEA